MPKWSMVVALVLFVLAGALTLRALTVGKTGTIQVAIGTAPPPDVSWKIGTAPPPDVWRAAKAPITLRVN